MQLSTAPLCNTGNHLMVIASTVNILNIIYKRFIDSLQLSI